MDENGNLVTVFSGASIEAELLKTALADVGLLCQVEHDKGGEPLPTAKILVPPEYADKATKAIEVAQRDLGGAADTTLMDGP